MSRKLALFLFAVAVLCHFCQGGELKVDWAVPSDLVSGDAALVDVQGNGFKEGSRVFIGGRESQQVIYISRRRLVALAPQGVAAGRQDVKVVNPDGKEAILASAINFESQLMMSSVEPSHIPESVKDIGVRIKGAGFIQESRVLFGDRESPSVTVKSDDYLVAVAPELAPGIMDVTVINPGGDSAVLYDVFQVMVGSAGLPVQKMKEEAAKYGIDGTPDNTDRGLAFADVNQDGAIDVLVITSMGLELYLCTEKGVFKNTTEESGLTFRGISYGGYFGDFDNDGLPDLVASGQPLKVYHNMGGARFEEVTERVGIPGLLKAWDAAWVDYDRDGLLDLFIGMLADDDYLFHNEGGRFVRVSPELFAKGELARMYEVRQPTTFSVAFADYDNDGFPDLFVGVRGIPSGLYHNEGGSGFKNVTESMGISPPISGPGGKGFYKPDWGIAWGDFDNDGFIDAFSASGPVGADLYRNREGKGFANVTKNMRAMFTQSVLSPDWGDFDNDGLLDLVVSDNLSGARVYKNQGDGSFKDVTEELGIINAAGNAPMGIAWIDVNADGALDLYAVEYMHPNRLFINLPYPGRHYLAVRLEGTTSNSMAIGAVVSVRAGGTIMTRHISGGHGYISQPPQTIHFGLGTSERVDLLTVKWPAGDAQTMEDVEADQILVIVEEGERKTVTLPAPPQPEKGSTVEAGATVEPGDTK